MLYESTSTRSRSSRRCPRPASGALLALLLFKTEFSVIALIGVILLIGIVKKNAIMMIDFALDAERRDGKPPEQAIFEACLLRFRPIMMTTMARCSARCRSRSARATAPSCASRSASRSSAACILSQLLTLYTTPVVYLYLDRFRLWCRQRWRGTRVGARAATEYAR